MTKPDANRVREQDLVFRILTILTSLVVIVQILAGRWRKK